MGYVLRERLQAGGPLILDGAMGTELHRRGVDTGLPLWSANGLIAHPEVVSRIHEDYVEAGADIITTDTFRTTRRSFLHAHLPDRSQALTALAVRLAREAAATALPHTVLVAGSMAPLEDCYRPDLVPPDAELFAEHREHAVRLANEGVDFILLETMNTVREAVAACTAARETGKEVVVSFICAPSGALYGGEPLEEAVAAVARLGPSACSINCVSPRTLGPIVERLKSLTDLPLAVYGNVGQPGKEKEEQLLLRDIDPPAYAGFAESWLRQGAAIIGGCCGTTPEYIRRIKSLTTKTPRHQDDKGNS
jgi:S-methylmethionine-dependent homocysteine/selenocysteine methylase